MCFWLPSLTNSKVLPKAIRVSVFVCNMSARYSVVIILLNEIFQFICGFLEVV